MQGVSQLSSRAKASAPSRPPAPPPSSRIEALDGLRGVAILMVVVFHAYARWPDLMPWAVAEGDPLALRYGELGVELFFMISGFVILMTLEKCRSFPEFLLKRWYRLFPGMLVATVLIYASAGLLSERPSGIPHAADVLPGLMFVQPGVLSRLLGFEVLPLEGAFWSLFIEVKFYALFGALYFLDRPRALHYLVGISLAASGWVLLTTLHPAWAPHELDRVVRNLLSLHYFGWFAMGALIYRASVTGQSRLVWLALALLVPSVLCIETTGPADLVVCLGLFALLLAAVHSRWFAHLVSLRPLTVMGFVSYPLYLIHESALVALTIKIHSVWPHLPGVLTPLPGFALLMLIAYVMARYGEPPLRRWIQSVIQRVGRSHRSPARPQP